MQNNLYMAIIQGANMFFKEIHMASKGLINLRVVKKGFSVVD